MLRNVVDSFSPIVRATLGSCVPTPDEVRAILKLAFLASEIDFETDPEETELLEQANRTLWELAGQAPEAIPVVSPLPLPDDGEARIARLHELAGQLQRTEVRELAYTVCYLFTVQDLSIVPIESALLDELAEELQLDEARANELVGTAAAMATPGTD